MRSRNNLFIKWILTIITLVCVISGVQGAQTYRISALSWNSEGNYLAIGDTNGKVTIWDVIKNQPLHSLQAHNGTVIRLLWSPDNKLLASVGDQIVKSWDVSSGTLLQTFEIPGTNSYTAFWAATPEHLVTVTEQNETTSYIVWDVESGTPVTQLASGTVTGSQWNNTKTQLVVGNINYINILDGDRLQILTTFSQPEITGSRFDVVTLAWNPDNTQIASGSLNGKIRVWDIASGKMLLDLQASNGTQTYGITSAVRNLRYVNNSELVSVRGDGVIRTWEISSGKILAEHMISENIGATAFSPYGGRLAYGLIADDVSELQAQTDHNADSLTVAGGAVKIIVPNPSLATVKSIASHCSEASSSDVENSTLATNVLSNLTVTNLPDFILQIKTLPSDAIPTACAADLIAVAEALIEQ